MENSSFSDLETLRELYRLSESDFSTIFEIITEEVAKGYLPSQTPTAIILGAQPGAGKTELQKSAERLLGNNAVICNADNLRDFHPLSKEIKTKHPEVYPELTAEYAQMWNNLLCKYCRENKLNYILETTFSSGERLNETILELKNNGYKVDIMLLAVSPKLSLLGTYIRYEESLQELGLGRKVSKVAHDSRFNAIPTTIEAISLKRFFDNISIYSRSIVLEYTSLVEGVTLVAHNPIDVMAIYREEVERPWSPKFKEYYKSTYFNIIRMMEQRSAPKIEIDLFKKECGTTGNRVKKNVLPRKRRSN
ncbi:MAG: hypothetical protein BGO31_20655 [Bacteroidetes bacterium 43-16]|uniref:zeta toxin family protein n=1 Tax=uncultured Dysgonomonas sp. TaxID=206096 RepID=UPI00092854FF|nr:zeta toxin family protein [uncultured Dysgonomonas sp.]OJV55343.1 MAG: hypothetical protein BGO31_20655 [Bacteroidetes bacterium 43-16]